MFGSFVGNIQVKFSHTYAVALPWTISAFPFMNARPLAKSVSSGFAGPGITTLTGLYLCLVVYKITNSSFYSHLALFFYITLFSHYFFRSFLSFLSFALFLSFAPFFSYSCSFLCSFLTLFSRGYTLCTVCRSTRVSSRAGGPTIITCVGSESANPSAQVMSGTALGALRSTWPTLASVFSACSRNGSSPSISHACQECF
jgi:hypothetical protein